MSTKCRTKWPIVQDLIKGARREEAVQIWKVLGDRGAEDLEIQLQGMGVDEFIAGIFEFVQVMRNKQCQWSEDRANM